MTPQGKDVLVVGAGVLGNVILDALDGDERWNCIGLVDDTARGDLQGYPIYAPHDPRLPRGAAAILAVGYPETKRRLLERVASLDLDWQTFVDRRSVVGRHVEFGAGCVVLQFATVTSGAILGRYCYVSAKCVVGAQARVGAYTSLMPGASLNDGVVGEECVLGFNSACYEGASLGDRVVLAPYACVRRPVASDSLAAGNPARVVRRRRPAAISRSGP